MLLIAVCLFASVYTALGMGTHYYRDGQVCDSCADGVVQYKESYRPDEVGKRVVYGTEERIISSRPSSSYVVNRADYSNRNLFTFYFFEKSLISFFILFKIF